MHRIADISLLVKESVSIQPTLAIFNFVVRLFQTHHKISVLASRTHNQRHKDVTIGVIAGVFVSSLKSLDQFVEFFLRLFGLRQTRAVFSNTPLGAPFKALHFIIPITHALSFRPSL